MSRRSATRILSDAYQKTKRGATQPSRVSLIVGGVKYRAGQPVARVCPVRPVSNPTLAKPL